MGGDAVARHVENCQAKGSADGELPETGDEELSAGGEDLGDVHLQADDEEKEDQADLRDDFDVVGDVDEAEAELWSDDGAGDEVAEDDGLAEAVCEEADHGGGDDGHSNVVKQEVHGWIVTMGEEVCNWGPGMGGA